jgi:hypothetical protein
VGEKSLPFRREKRIWDRGLVLVWGLFGGFGWIALDVTYALDDLEEYDSEE